MRKRFDVLWMGESVESAGVKKKKEKTRDMQMSVLLLLMRPEFQLIFFLEKRNKKNISFYTYTASQRKMQILQTMIDKKVKLPTQEFCICFAWKLRLLLLFLRLSVSFLEVSKCTHRSIRVA